MTGSVREPSDDHVIAVMSDSHDDVACVDSAAAMLVDAGVRRVIHCGDIASPVVVERLAGFRVEWVLGNCDSDPEGLAVAVRAIPGHALHGWRVVLEVGDLTIGATHGHRPGEFAELRRAGCDWIVHGHSHQVRDDALDGVRFLNPGALHRARPCTMMLAEPRSRRVRWTEVPRSS